MWLKKEVGKNQNRLFVGLELISHTYTRARIVYIVHCVCVILPEAPTHTLMYEIGFLCEIFTGCPMFLLRETSATRITFHMVCGPRCSSD